MRWLRSVRLRSTALDEGFARDLELLLVCDRALVEAWIESMVARLFPADVRARVEFGIAAMWLRLFPADARAQHGFELVRCDSQDVRAIFGSTACRSSLMIQALASAC
jgi:hypothetical protein